jgi:hypothetical protein
MSANITGKEFLTFLAIPSGIIFIGDVAYRLFNDATVSKAIEHGIFFGVITFFFVVVFFVVQGSLS